MRFILLLCLVSLFTCQDPKTTPGLEKENGLLSGNLTQKFPDVLNYKGVPIDPKDRSVFAFSDQGAWHGYALPDTTHKGSFIGPFLMTQQNGIWIGPSISQLKIYDLETRAYLDFEKATNFESHSFPGRLSQELNVNGLGIKMDLIFASNRIALIQVEIHCTAKKVRQLKFSWEGNTFLSKAFFSDEGNALKIEFTGRKQIGGIQSSHQVTSITTERGEKEWQHFEMLLQDTFILDPHQSFYTYLAHSFTFNEMEWQEEQSKIQAIFKTPKTYLTDNEQRWNQYLSKILIQEGGWQGKPSYQRVAVKSLLTLINNWRSPAGFLKHAGLFPAYNYEWFHGFWSWDSWKHAVALAYFHPELAKNQIRAMFDFQDEFGMIADCVYRDTIIEVHNWRNTKPPLSAWAVWEVYEKTGDFSFLQELFPKIKKYHEWWYQYRDNDKNGLCEYGSTDGTLIAAKWESGMDNAVRFDDAKMIGDAQKGWTMNQESVDLNAYLFAEKQYMAKIAKHLELNEEAAAYQGSAKALKEKIQTHFFDEHAGFFFDKRIGEKEFISIKGPEGWIPLWTEIATAEQANAVKDNLLDTTLFATPIPFPTLMASHPKFNPLKGYWRGPVWLDQAYFAIKGLEKYGFEKEANRFTHQLFNNLQGLKNSPDPIRENYHPITGEGLNSKHFSWSAAHLLLLLWE